MSDMEKQDAVLMEFRWRPFKVTEMAAEIARLRDENAALTAAVERVRALHQRAVVVRELYGPANWCSRCGSSFPCSTLRALEETP